MQSVAYIRYPTHHVSITVNHERDLIHCFKYNNSKSRCDLKTFNLDEQEACADYIMLALPTWEWGFVEDSSDI